MSERTINTDISYGRTITENPLLDKSSLLTLGSLFLPSRFFPQASLISQCTVYRVDVEDFWFCCLPTLPLTVAEQPYARKDITNARIKNMLVRFFIIVLQIKLVEYVCMSMIPLFCI